MRNDDNIATIAAGEAELADLLERMADEVKAKGAVDLGEWRERFPELASEIERLAPTLEALVEFSGGRGPAESVEDEEEFRHKTLGDFRIVRELGRGGMGIVYE